MTTSTTADAPVTVLVRPDFDSHAAAFARAMGHLDRTAPGCLALTSPEIA